MRLAWYWIALIVAGLAGLAYWIYSVIESNSYNATQNGASQTGNVSFTVSGLEAEIGL
jgi:hypothetical protein